MENRKSKRYLYDAEYRRSHPAQESAKRKKHRDKIKATKPWQLYVYECRKKNGRGHAWGLTDKQAQEVMSQECHYCGTSGNPYVGLDRKDSSKDYVIDNVLPSCTTCNYAKRLQSYNEFRNWVLRAAEHIKKQDEEDDSQMWLL